MFGGFFSNAIEDFLGTKVKVKKEAAKLLDTHQYTVNGIVYEQKVYRLADKTIYTETDVLSDASIELLEEQKRLAVEEQRFEDAAKLRDKLEVLKTN
jgi:excinuclease UvrABC nuclease subunit